MAIPPRTRKRVRAIPRASDGSAFQKCDICGNSVAIALADMHECRSSQEVKRFKGIRASEKDYVEDRFLNQPRSAFRFFMEEFKATCESVDPIEIDRNGFEEWKNMSNEERQPYVRQANYVNFRYDKALHKEEDKFPKWEDCSDSGCHTHQAGEKRKTKFVGISDRNHAWLDDSGDSDYSGWLFHEESDE